MGMISLVYFEDERGRRSAAKLLTRDEAGRIAAQYRRAAHTLGRVRRVIPETHRGDASLDGKRAWALVIWAEVVPAPNQSRAALGMPMKCRMRGRRPADGSLRVEVVLDQHVGVLHARGEHTDPQPRPGRRSAGSADRLHPRR